MINTTSNCQNEKYLKKIIAFTKSVTDKELPIRKSGPHMYMLELNPNDAHMYSEILSDTIKALHKVSVIDNPVLPNNMLLFEHGKDADAVLLQKECMLYFAQILKDTIKNITKHHTMYLAKIRM